MRVVGQVGFLNLLGRLESASARPSRLLTWLTTLCTLGLVLGGNLFVAQQHEMRFNVVVAVADHELWAHRLPEDSRVRQEFVFNPWLTRTSVQIAILSLAAGVVASRRAIRRGARPEAVSALVSLGALGLSLAGIWDCIFNVFSQCFVSVIVDRIDGLLMVLLAPMVLLCAPRRPVVSTPRAPSHPPYR
jgi:hypothetical protein